MGRLDLALIGLFPELSRRKARAVIEKGQVTVDGATIREAGQDVGTAARIEWNPHRKALPRARSTLPLLYEDDSLVVVDKPAGLLSVPSAPDATDEDTVAARLFDYVRHLRPRRPYVGVVHRLDRDTSGALAFALSPAARASLRELFREHRLERSYVALVQGTPRAPSGTIDQPIHTEYRAGRRRLAGPGEPSLPALTRWHVRERFPGAALLDVQLETGRQHQIRVHLAHQGLPVLGDPVYGKTAAPLAVRRPMLHARRLAFIHPLSGSAIEVESPLPADFREALAALRARSRRGGGGLGCR
jgi:23S rRNA pseudouridine1911/1915/1917 synthase